MPPITSPMRPHPPLVAPLHAPLVVPLPAVPLDVHLPAQRFVQTRLPILRLPVPVPARDPPPAILAAPPEVGMPAIRRPHSPRPPSLPRRRGRRELRLALRRLVEVA